MNLEGGQSGEIVKLLLKFGAKPCQVAKLKSKNMNAYEMALLKNNEVAAQVIEEFVGRTLPEGCLQKDWLLRHEKASSNCDTGSFRPRKAEIVSEDIFLRDAYRKSPAIDRTAESKEEEIVCNRW